MRKCELCKEDYEEKNSFQLYCGNVCAEAMQMVRKCQKARDRQAAWKAASPERKAELIELARKKIMNEQ